MKGGDVHLKGTLERTDIFRGAFLLCMGARLDKDRVRNNARRIKKLSLMEKGSQ